MVVIEMLFIEKFKKNIRTTDDIESELLLKSLAMVPFKDFKSKQESKSELISYESEKSELSKAFKRLRINIQFLNVNNDNKKVILITSAKNSEGKSFVASNIAVSFAEVGKKVILIDADMNSGRQGKIFNIPNNLGLSNYLANLDTNSVEVNEFLNKYINETSIRKLNIITSGTIPPNSSELLASPKLEELIKDLNIFYDIIIIDGTSILNTNDSLILARIANSTILVADYNKSKVNEMEKAKQNIQNVSGKILGVVINKTKSKKNFKKIWKNFNKNLKSLFENFKKIIKKKINKHKTKLLTETTNIPETKKTTNNNRKKIIEKENKKTENIKESKINETIDISKETVDYFSENTVLVVVDAESAFCRVFSRHSFVEKFVRSLNKSIKPQYSLSRIYKKHERLRNRYNLSKKQVKRVDPLIYNTLRTYDEEVLKDQGKKSNKAEAYINCITKEYKKLDNENNIEYIVRCQRLRKLELAKSELEIEYKLDNLWFSNKMKFIDKISMKQFAKFYEINSKLKNDYEIKKSQKNKAFYNDIVNATDNNLEIISNNNEELKKEKIKNKKRKIKKNKAKKIKKEDDNIDDILEDNLYPKTKSNKDLL